MTKLTLPIEIGKKYLRRDGMVVAARPAHPSFEESGESYLALISAPMEDEDKDDVNIYRATGRVRAHYSHDEYQTDLISDYLEPAKGHPHAEKMAEFAQDARETDKPWDRWEWLGASGTWHPADSSPTWERFTEFRRKPTITPDPHAASMLMYAQDAAETDRAWERWEMRNGHNGWVACCSHPDWARSLAYRRKAQS